MRIKDKGQFALGIFNILISIICLIILIIQHRTRWFKDYDLYTKGWAIIKFWGGLVLALFGIKNVYESGGLNTLNRIVDAKKEDEVEDNFDETTKF